MKKTLSLILAVVLMFTTANTAFALGQSAPNASSGKNVELTTDFILNSVSEVQDGVITFSKATSLGNEQFVNDTIFVVPAEGVSAQTLLNDLSAYAQKAANTRDSMTMEKFDPSISIEGWVRVNYLRTESTYGTAAKVTGVSGGYRRSDTSVFVTSQSLNYGCSGKSAISGLGITQRESESPTGTSWSYTAPSNWVYIVQAPQNDIGANCTFYLKRSTSTWSFLIDCRVREDDM